MITTYPEKWFTIATFILFMAKVLLINPSYSPSYGGTKVSVVNLNVKTGNKKNLNLTAEKLRN